MELLPNLYWIEGRSSNIFRWRDEAGLLMVDTGMPGDTAKIQAAASAKPLLKLAPAVFACGHGRPFVYHEAADIMMLSLQLEDPVI